MGDLNNSKKLRSAINEIRKITDKYDLAALVILHTPQQGEFFLKINPSYSCAHFVNNEQYIKIKNTHFKDKDKKKKVLEDTINMIDTLATCAANKSISLIDVYKNLESQFDIESSIPKIRNMGTIGN